MTAPGNGPPPASSRVRMAVALATAGLATGALGGNVIAANAEAPAGDTATTTTSTTPAETTTTAPPETTVPDTTTTEPPATTTQPSPPPPPAPTGTSTQTTHPSAVAPAAPAAPYYPPLPMQQPGAGGSSTSSSCINSAADIRERAALKDLTVAEKRELSIARRLYVIRCAPDLKPSPAKKHTTGVTAADAPRGSTDGLDEATRTELRNAQGVPTLSNPTMSLALPGAAPIGVPNFFIDKFRIPVFLLPIYQAAGIEYGVRWEVLAAINEIETDYGRNLNISSAGAMGWMQFMPETWKTYGVDANGDGIKDPFNPVDAIFAAARYLKAAGADSDLRKAIFAYNHADWYVESVLMRARLIGGLPSDLVGSLSGLTQGRFPVDAKARYADDLAEQAARRKAKGTKGKAGRANVALPVESDATRVGIDIFAAPGSPVIAVADGRIVSVGRSKRLGNFVSLVDAYGNTYTYAHLKKIAAKVPVPKERKQSAGAIAAELELPKADPKPTVAATAGKPTTRRPKLAAPAAKPTASLATAAHYDAVEKERLFAHPARRNVLRFGGAKQLAAQESSLARGETLRSYLTGSAGLDADDFVLKRLIPGQRVVAGTILGRIGVLSKRSSPHVHFEIRPAGRGAPRVDPKPILDGWKLLEATAIYRARGTNVLAAAGADDVSIGQILLMTKEQLAQRVLANPRIEIYSCGRQDIRAGAIDRRVLAVLEFLAASGLKPTVTSLHCGHSRLTTSGNVSEHSIGSAVDIAKINGIPILDHQGEGSITDIAIQRLLTLQGTMKPHQIISLMTYQGADNTLALPDHADHIHVGYAPEYAPGSPGANQLGAVLKPSQWLKLIDRIGQIDNPEVATTPSRYAIKAPQPRASKAHRGE
jgi:murein DD-endopeptidase MepM/ murein hydrolase activator NlpD